MPLMCGRRRRFCYGLPIVRRSAWERRLLLFIGATAGYAFAKKIPGAGAHFALVIATMLLPRQMLLIPNYLVAMKLHLTNSRIGLILTTVSPAFVCVFMQAVYGKHSDRTAGGGGR